MARCKSTYQNRNTLGEPLGKPFRCTREEGHPLTTGPGWQEMHQNMRPGRRIRWPQSAAQPDTDDVGGES